jgi:hypothetical protein
MIDRLIPAIVAGVLLLHGIAFLWSAVLRKGVAAVIWLNLMFGAVAVAYWAPHLLELFDYVPAAQAFAAFEFAVLVTSLLAVFRFRVPRAVIWAEFGVDFLLSAAAFIFIAAFKITRLI